MSPIWETFANASVRGYRATVKNVTYFLALVVMPTRGTSSTNTGGNAANATHAYFSFRHSNGNAVHRFTQEGVFAESLSSAGGSGSNLGSMGANATTVAGGLFSTRLTFWSPPSNYYLTQSRRNLSGQATYFLNVASDGFSYVNGIGAAQRTIAKYSPSGVVQWIQNISGAGGVGDCDLDGNVYSCANGANPEVTKINPSGTRVWSRQTSTYSTATLNGFCADRTNGGAYLASTVSSLQGLFRLDTSGNLLWGITAGNVYQTKAVTSFGNSAYWLLERSANQNENLLIKLDATTGAVIWQRTFGGAYLTMNNGYQAFFTADADAVYLNFVQTSSSGMYEWHYCFKYPASGVVTGSYALGWTINIGVGSASMGTFTPALSTTTPSLTGASGDSDDPFSPTLFSTTQTIIKVP
jgi:hypothetical protein